MPEAVKATKEETGASAVRRVSRRHHRHRRGARQRWGGVLAAMLMAVAVGAWGWFLLAPPRQASSVAPAPMPAVAVKSKVRGAILRPVSLPRDDAPHAAATEWWHYQGHLSAEGGRRYSFHVAVLLRAGVVRQTVFHGSLNEYRRGTRFTQQRRTEGVPSPQGAAGFDFAHGDWRVAGAGGAHRLRFGGEGFSLELELSDAGEPVLHGAAGSATPGALDFGEAGVGYLYSRPRMKASGTLGIAGAGSVEVQGEAWFDHQWGDFEAARLAWNRFALQLDDGANVMLYQLFDQAGTPFRVAGTYTGANGRNTALAPADVALIPMGVWKSPGSGVRYPAGWAMRIPQGSFVLKPLRQASEFDGLETTSSHYWEGAVDVAGAREGVGFVEMSGYDRIPTVQPAE